MSVGSPRALTAGVVFIHATPAALCLHVTWALEAALGNKVAIDWTAQPSAFGQMRGEISWTGQPGTGAKITGALKGFTTVRFEVTEEPSPGNNGSNPGARPAPRVDGPERGRHGQRGTPQRSPQVRPGQW